MYLLIFFYFLQVEYSSSTVTVLVKNVQLITAKWSFLFLALCTSGKM